jgi:DNA-binding LacI/PurR family transcriptional regulator
VSTGAPNVREATRQRVLDAMDQLGYSPNMAARALRYGRFGTIGLIAHQLADTGESRTAEAVIEAARDEGYNVTLVDVETPTSQDLDAAVQRMTHQAIDGLVITHALTANPTTLSLPPRLSVVVSDLQFLGQHPAVGADQTGGIAAAMGHLLRLGHRTVHHIAGPAGSVPTEVRLTAWRTTLLAAGRPIPEPLYGDWSAASGYEAGRLLASDPDVTAVLAANDEMAAGLLLALHEQGRDVPREVSVVGFDDIPLAAFTWPPLTTVRQDFREIGVRLIDLLLRQMRDGENLAGHHEVVPTTFVERASTGPAPA